MLKHCAANRKRRLKALPNVSPYITTLKFLGLQGAPYIYISRLRDKYVTKVRLRMTEQIKIMVKIVKERCDIAM
jgi:hypothetical protein